MFRRTYYVQRAERRNDGEPVMRDTSFASFMCILFIFALFTCLIVIVSNWRFLFLIEDEIEYFDQSNQNENQFGKIIISDQNNGNFTETTQDFTSDDINSSSSISNRSPTTESSLFEANSVGSGRGFETDETESVETATITEMEFSVFSTLFATFTRSSLFHETVTTVTYDVNQTDDEETETPTETETTSENTQRIETESELTDKMETSDISEITETSIETTQNIQLEENDTNETEREASRENVDVTTNVWFYLPKLSTTTESTETESTSITESTEKQETVNVDDFEGSATNSEIKTTDWKRDASVGSTDLIDLDTTESEIIIYGAIKHFRTTPFRLPRTTRNDYPLDVARTTQTTIPTETIKTTETTETTMVTESTEATEMSETTETTPSTEASTMTTSFEDNAVRSVNGYNEKSKLKPLQTTRYYLDKIGNNDQTQQTETISTTLATTTEPSTIEIINLGPLARRMHNPHKHAILVPFNVNDLEEKNIDEIDMNEMYTK